ncbi:MAG: DNA polymerase III subunit gamma/tau [Chloroflexota bacterium]
MTKSTSSPSATAPPAADAPHQAIYRRWRAQTFAQIVGQTAVVQTLQNAVRTGRVAHAILFVGPRGTGKTSLARILAKAINCTNLQDGDPCDTCPSCVAIREGRALDLIEIDAASNRGIDAIRELRERINYAPTDLRRKVYILDEAHQITKDAWNALLKSLEEPPDFVVFMFASTHPQDFPPAILSRLQRFDVRRLSPSEIEGKLARILEGDGRVAEPSAIQLIARLAAGGMRDAESMLDQLLASGGDRLDEAMVRDLLGLAPADAIDGFVTAMVDGDVGAGIRILDELEDRGRDLRAFLEQLVELVRAGLIGPGSVPGTQATAAGSGIPDSRSVAVTVAIARRLGDIDPNRAGIGGLRLQLELALFPNPPELQHSEPGPRPPQAVGPGGPPAPTARPEAVRPDASRAAKPEPPHDAASTRAAAATPASTSPPVTKPQPAPADTEPVATKAHATVSPGGPPPTGTTPATAPASRPVTTGPAPAPAAVPPAPVGGDATSDIDRLRHSWPEVVRRLSAHPPTKPLIAVCLPMSVENNVVTLGFPEDQGFLRDVAERRRSILEESIGSVLGKSVGVRCVATNLDNIPALPADTEAAFVLAEARRIFEADEPDAAEVS